MAIRRPRQTRSRAHVHEPAAPARNMGFNHGNRGQRVGQMNDLQIGDGRFSDKTLRGGYFAQAVPVGKETIDRLRGPKLHAQFAYDLLKSGRYFESLLASSSDVVFDIQPLIITTPR